MSELESQLIPELNEKMSVWLRYVDDTFTIIKKDEIENVKNILNNFHTSIKFTHEIEKELSIPFLDVKVHREVEGTFSTSVYRKETDTDIYVHWKAHAPKTWKIGTLKGLFRRAISVSSDETKLKNEVDHLKHVFVNVNQYPKKVVENTFKLMKAKIRAEREVHPIAAIASTEMFAPEVSSETEPTFPHIILPYKGFRGEKLVKSFRKTLANVLPKKCNSTIYF